MTDPVKELTAEEAEAGALKEFEETVKGKDAKTLIDWWARHYGKCGHKRLGRILVKASKEKVEA